MTASVFSATTIGYNGEQIEVECDASNGLPGILIVGLGNKAVDEAKERVRSAIKNSGLEFPRKRITINLAPANLPKVGAHFDLSIAIAILVIGGKVQQEDIKKTMFVGELALDGSLRPIRGVINYAEIAKKQGHEEIIVPLANAKQAALIEDIAVLPAQNLKEVFTHISGQDRITPWLRTEENILTNTTSTSLHDVKGQEQAKRALLIAAAGNHNILLSGPPGAGKTMLAQALASILPPLEKSEIIEVTKINSLSNSSSQEVITSRPFRSPHHTASHVSLVGGGQLALPGEISLAHKGVLFLDELPEYSRQTLESLRQPLEDRLIHISRALHHVSYPADFMLVATQNPCPCGYLDDPNRECTCTPHQIAHYQKKLSGPLLDRIDMFVEVSRVNPDTLLLQNKKQTEVNFAKLVESARYLQYKRYGRNILNAHINNKQIASKSFIQPEAQQVLDLAARTLQLSARSFFKVIKIARTIADLEESKTIEAKHISEALQYRKRTQDLS